MQCLTLFFWKCLLTIDNKEIRWYLQHKSVSFFSQIGATCTIFNFSGKISLLKDKLIMKEIGADKRLGFSL